MPGFKGQAENSVDSKGRVTVPSKMRKAMNEEANKAFTITRGFENCIHLYPMDRWREMEKEFAQLNQFNREARHFMRTVLRWAEETSLDGQGRVKMPSRLMDFGALNGEALIIGSYDHIEVWNPEVFDAYLNEQPADYETLAERVMGV